VATFYVQAIGCQPISFSWYENGHLLSNGIVSTPTNSTLTISHVQSSDNGASIYAMAANGFGADFSSNAFLYVSGPQILVQPQNQYACVGSSATFYVQAIGSQPLSFAWFSNGVPINAGVTSSITNSWLTLPNVQISSSAPSFWAVASNQCGTMPSTTASLYVSAPVTITQNPLDATNVTTGSTLTFNVQATPTPLAYNWWFQGTRLTNSAHIQGANSTTLIIFNAQLSDAGYYHAQVSNGCVVLDSLPALCNIGTCPLVITNQPLNYVAPFQSTVQFVVGAQGAPPLSYQWFRNDVAIPGATLPVLTLPNVQRPQIGVYHVVVSNVCAVVCSDRVHLQIELSYESALVPRQEATDFWSPLTNALRIYSPPPTVIFHGVPLLFSTYGATAEAWETNRCGIPPSHSMWVLYYSPRLETNVVSTEGSSFPTVLGIYTWNGNPTNYPAQIACDVNSGYDGRTSLLHFLAAARTDYYIAVDGVGSASGTARLQIGDIIRNTHFDEPNGPFRFEMAGPYWYSLALRSSTNLMQTQTQWTNLLTIPATNQDYVVRYTNANPRADGQRFYYTVVSTNSASH